MTEKWETHSSLILKSSNMSLESCFKGVMVHLLLLVTLKRFPVNPLLLSLTLSFGERASPLLWRHPVIAQCASCQLHIRNISKGKIEDELNVMNVNNNTDLNSTYIFSEDLIPTQLLAPPLGRDKNIIFCTKSPYRVTHANGKHL